MQVEAGCPIRDHVPVSPASGQGKLDFMISVGQAFCAHGSRKGEGSRGHGDSGWPSEAFDTRKSCLELREKPWTSVGGLNQ